MAKLASIDTIGLLNEEIAKLEKHKARLCSRIKDYRGVGTYEGKDFVGVVYEADSVKPNFEKLKKKLGADWRKYITVSTMTCLRVEKKGARKHTKD